MKQIKYLIITIVVLLVAVFAVSYSYFSANVINNPSDTVVSSGKVELSIDDESINAVEIAPIYDEDYEMLAIHKNFAVISNSSLNSCVNIYLNVEEISDSLKSEYFKYKIINGDNELIGDFKNAKSHEKMLVLDNVFIEGSKEKTFDLYIWVSYQENVNQTNMLNSKIKSNIYIEGKDVKSREQCSIIDINNN
jgi:hypothetical protein